MTFSLIAATYAHAVSQIADRLERGVPTPQKLALASRSAAASPCTHKARKRSSTPSPRLALAPSTQSFLSRLTPKPRAQYSASTNLKLADAAGSARTDYGGLDFAYAFHWDGVPKEIVEADVNEGFPSRRTTPFFGGSTRPGCSAEAMQPGQVAAQAAATATPVFLGFGERDISPNPDAEPSAYLSCRDITLMIVPTMAHMHNFASTRALLWDRLVDWSSTIARQRARRE